MSILRVATHLDLETVRFAISRSNPAAGIMVLALPPPGQTLAPFGLTVLAGLGIDFDAGKPVWGEINALELAVGRLRARSIRDLVIVNSDWLPCDQLERICQLLYLAVDRAWLVTPIEVNGSLEALLTGMACEAHLTDLIEMLSQPHHTGSAGRQAFIRCDVPGQLVEVPCLYDHRSRDFLLAYFTAHAYLAGRRLSEQIVTHASHRVLLAGGVGKAFLEGVFGLAAALERFSYRILADPCQIDLGLDPNHESLRPRWSDLARFAWTDGPALVALRATGLDLAEMAQIPIRAVSGDGRSVVWRDEVRDVPREARTYLVAQRLARLGQTADENETLLSRDHRSPTEGALAKKLASTLRAIGFQVDPGYLSRVDSRSRSWLAEHGLRVAPAGRAGAPVGQDGPRAAPWTRQLPTPGMLHAGTLRRQEPSIRQRLRHRPVLPSGRE